MFFPFNQWETLCSYKQGSYKKAGGVTRLDIRKQLSHGIPLFASTIQTYLRVFAKRRATKIEAIPLHIIK